MPEFKKNKKNYIKCIMDLMETIDRQNYQISQLQKDLEVLYNRLKETSVKTSNTK